MNLALESEPQYVLNGEIILRHHMNLTAKTDLGHRYAMRKPRRNRERRLQPASRRAARLPNGRPPCILRRGRRGHPAARD